MKISELLGKKSDWQFIVDRTRSPFINHIMLEGMTKSYLEKDDFSFHKGIYADGPWYINTPENIQIFKKIELELNDNLKSLRHFCEICEKTIDENFKLWNKIKSKDIKTLSNQELAEIFKEYSTSLIKINQFLQSMMFREDVITKILKQKLKNDNDLFLKLTIPNKESYFTEFNKKLLKFAAAKDYCRIDEFIEEYGWIKDQNFRGDWFNAKEIKQKIDDLSKQNPEQDLKLMEESRKKDIEEFKKAAKDLDKYTKELAELASWLVYLRTYRTDVQYKSFFMLKEFFKEAAERCKVSLDDLLFLRHTEIISLLKGEDIEKNIISKRKKGYGIILAKDNRIEIFGSDLDELKEFLKEEELEETYLEGSTACKGYAKGTAKIVMKIEDMKKMEKGDILISSMTRPDLVPAMEKAAAFVTDEGGITCHAAIVSREMNKPCVVGTGKATKLFKDGDLVEVDADNGIVRKL